MEGLEDKICHFPMHFSPISTPHVSRTWQENAEQRRRRATTFTRSSGESQWKPPTKNLLGQWLNFKLFGIPYLVGKISRSNFNFRVPLAKRENHWKSSGNDLEPGVTYLITNMFRYLKWRLSWTLAAWCCLKYFLCSYLFREMTAHFWLLFLTNGLVQPLHIYIYTI